MTICRWNCNAVSWPSRLNTSVEIDARSFATFVLIDGGFLSETLLDNSLRPDRIVTTSPESSRLAHALRIAGMVAQPRNTATMKQLFPIFGIPTGGGGSDDGRGWGSFASALLRRDLELDSILCFGHSSSPAEFSSDSGESLRIDIRHFEALMTFPFALVS